MFVALVLFSPLLIIFAVRQFVNHFSLYEMEREKYVEKEKTIRRETGRGGRQPRGKIHFSPAHIKH